MTGENKIHTRRAKVRTYLEAGHSEMATVITAEYYLKDTQYLLDRIKGLVHGNAEMEKHIAELARMIKGE